LSAYDATARTCSQPRIPSRLGELATRTTALGVTHAEALGLGILLIAAAFPAAPPTAASLITSGSAPGIWAQRYGGANIFEVAMVVWAGLWIVRSLAAPPRRFAFDRQLLALALGLLALQALALRYRSQMVYLGPDSERLALVGLGYFIASRCVRDRRVLEWFACALATVIALRAIELVVRYGLTGQTEFVTILGRSALLITEDALLLVLPVMLLWGALVDGRQRLWPAIGSVVFTLGVIVVNLLSLRRGGVIIIGTSILVRSLALGRRRLAVAFAALLVAFSVAVALGPGRPVLDQVRYTVTSATLRSNDASSGQRQAELESFVRDMQGFDWVGGRGFGVLWRAVVKSPEDTVSFGSGENAFTRLGWHVYGLDWLYKFGLLGAAFSLTVLFSFARRLWKAQAHADPRMRWLIRSLGVTAPSLLLLAFTNQRIALMAGVVLGLLARCQDLSSPSTRASYTASP